MSVNNLLETSTVNFSDIIGYSKTYTVPPYQRDYSWKRDEWEDLWNDILAIRPSGQVHYMGSIVLQNMGNKNYHVIDGQQRFATLTLIVLATIHRLQELIDSDTDAENNEERVALIKKKFIGDKDPGSLTYSSKLKLNENNNSFFQSNLLVFRPPVNVNALQDSDKLIWQAYNFFTEKFSIEFKNEKNGNIITDFLNKHIAEKLMFIQIVVENELSAYTVFETLNSRGVGLTVTDLLKNYLFSITSKVDLPHVKDKWKKIVDIIGLDTFPVFLRHYWISKNQLIRQEYLFRAIKESVTDSMQVIDLLDSLEENARLYNALSNYADSYWAGNKEIKKRIKELNLFKERQAYPILMAAYNSFAAEEFSKVLKFISIITFRYTIIAKRHTNLKEEVYNKAAVQISNKKTSNLKQLLKSIKPLYLSDNEFKNDFSIKAINTKRGKKLVRYILFSIENHLIHADFDFEENPGTIEHILPENGNENYIEDFPASIHETFAYRLGNYSILEDDKNKECETLPFDEKKKIFQTSQYELSKRIKQDSWTPNTLDKRQEKLAAYAASIWRISQYDE